MHDNPLNPQGWNPNLNPGPGPGAIPPYSQPAPPSQPPPQPPYPEDEEEYDEDVSEEALGDDSLQGAPDETESDFDAAEEEPAELVASGPSFATKVKALAATGGAACLKLAGAASAQLAKLPSILRKRKSDDLASDPTSEDAALIDDTGDPTTIIEGAEAGDEPGSGTVTGGFLKTRSSRIQAAALVSTGLLTTALVAHNLLKPDKPSPSANDSAASKPESKKPAEVAKVQVPAKPAPEPAPEPAPTVVSEPVAPPPTAIAAAPPEPITAEPTPIAASPPEPSAAAPVDPLVPNLAADAAGAEPPPAMPALPPTETVAATSGVDPVPPPPTLIPEAPEPVAAPEIAPTETAASTTEGAPATESIAATTSPASSEAPPALAATPAPAPTPTPTPESAPAPSLPEPSVMAAAPALAIPSLASPPALTPDSPAPPESMPALPPESTPAPAPVVAEAPQPPPTPTPEPEPEPTPLVAEAPQPPPTPAEPVATASPAAAAPAVDLSDLKPLPNAGRRVLTMGTPIGGPLPVDTITVAPPASAPVAAAAVPISAESFQVEHVVQSGENFWTISKLYYGSGRFYKALWKANARTVQAPDALVVGNTIVVPPPESLDRTLIDPPGGNIASNGRSTVRDPSARRTVQGADGSMNLPVGRSRALAESVATLEPETPRPSHIVRDGETLRSIARDRLGNSRRESEIRQLNLDVIPDDQLVVGQRLRLPNDATATQRR